MLLRVHRTQPHEITAGTKSRGALLAFVVARSAEVDTGFSPYINQEEQMGLQPLRQTNYRILANPSGKFTA
jgi:hypothetical protein